MRTVKPFNHHHCYSSKKQRAIWADIAKTAEIRGSLTHEDVNDSRNAAAAFCSRQGDQNITTTIIGKEGSFPSGLNKMKLEKGMAEKREVKSVACLQAWIRMRPPNASLNGPYSDSVWNNSSFGIYTGLHVQCHILAQ